MAADAERNSERQSDLAVMDANEYKQKRRLERILDAMDKIEDQANEAWDLFVKGQISHDAKNIMIQRAVKEAIRESYKLLIDHQNSLQEEHDVADLMAADGGMHWEAMSDYWLARRDQPIGVIPQVNNDDIVIWGLRDFLDTEEFYLEEWVEREKPRNQPPTVVEHESETSVPERVSWAAALRLKEFLDDEHGMEIKFEELDDRLPNWGFDELEEVPDDVEVI
jgi:hypothetical protein